MIRLNEIVEISLRSIYVNTFATALASFIAIPFALVVDFWKSKFKNVVVLIFQSLMGIPPVLVGLLVFLLFSRSGPFGGLDILFSSTAMIIAQVLIAFPIVFSVCYSHFSRTDEKLKLIVKTLGASNLQAAATIVRESLPGVISAVLTAFGRVAGEVGAVMIVGGNIAGRTRVLTTAIVLYTNLGKFKEAIFAGLCLLAIAIGVNLIATFISFRWR
ncbi:ABC transporter permease [Pseudothermotoga thermarum]|uniref:ABC transporter permease n=1 Tax=Pseudothermotoga thermarum TaxID=119394 RepID=UPI0038993B99